MPGWEIIGKKEQSALNKLFREGGILFAHGFDKFRKKYHVREFEKESAKKFKSKYAVAVTSGTAAIKIGLKALGVKRGDEVITQGFNFIATIEAILDIGAIPIMVNVDNSLNMSPLDLKKMITKKTKAIIPVHMLGVPVDMDEIIKIAKKKKIKILEDNCEAVGAKYKNKFLGSIRDVGVASYDFSKTITCGEGGMIFTNNKKIYKYSKEYHDHGHENNPRFKRGEDTKSIVGFNYRMTEMQAVIGKVQLGKLNYILKEQKKRYLELEKKLKNKFELRKIPNKSEIIYDTFIFFEKNKIKRNRIIKLLNKEGFGTKNLPDAIKWHCASYWDHALPKKQIIRIEKTKEILSISIAIPISLKKSVTQYRSLSRKISNLFKIK